MCFDERTSWITFVLGATFCVFNIVYFKNVSVTIVSVLFLFTLLMQLFEGLAWRTQNAKTSRLHFWATQGALIANVMQPIVVGLLCLALLGGTTRVRTFAILLMGAYMMWLIWNLNNSPAFTVLTPKEGCTHLNLAWWDSFSKNMKGINGALPYLVCLIGVIVLLLRPMDLMIFELAIILITLLISSVFYSCGVGSMWCWLVASAPLLTGIYWYYTRTVQKR